jgi:BirA family biotin operon repressor/biotin-[acetyl-CoA-carboxylase] ligase
VIVAGTLPPDLAAAIDASAPRLSSFVSSVVFHPTIGSTNDVARDSGVEGAVVIAGAQTAGRGRRGRSWFSPPGAGLYVSTVLAPGRAQVEPARATRLLTLAAGVALAEGIAASTDLAVDLKWPNDLYFLGRKLGGILAESVRDVVVLGYGINIRPAACPPELRDRIESLEGATGRSVDRGRVLVETLSALAARYADLLDGRFDAILDAWRGRAPAAVGARIEWDGPGGRRGGTTAGIDRDGALTVKTDAGIERIVGGEIRWC